MGALPWSVGATVLTYVVYTRYCSSRSEVDTTPPKGHLHQLRAITTKEVEGHTSQVLADKALLHLSSPTGSIALVFVLLPIWHVLLWPVFAPEVWTRGRT